MRQFFLILSMSLMALCSYGEESLSRQGTMEQSTTPRYLYKMLSIQDWKVSKSSPFVKLSAADKDFIHFSTDDQLDKIIDKYWGDVLSFVMLKVDTQKLPGRMVFEANPGGINRYYHLYDGAIPLDAVTESRFIERRNEQAKHDLKSLPVVQVGEPVLRQLARPLSKEDILSQDTQDLIQQMKAAMEAAPGVGLAAPQIGKALQIIVIEDKSDYHTSLTTLQLAERGRVPVPFHVIINPSLHIIEEEKVEFFEGCLSIPELIGVVPRAKTVRVECLNEMAQPVVINATGWYARILQHEIDHLNGVLFIDRAHARTLMTQDNYAKYWKNKSIFDIKKSLGIY
ncbi:peptide deformylase [Candidatus Protochlamydia phocaeensis]|uniref:peptide deformylase n=1 Tax=Candidatus Protochlamydia phocaeensis TaxID=1414722 RepID=UPI0009AE7F5B|nr:peptide deformylase [Candidatus Protochlamydia phocaeensis]